MKYLEDYPVMFDQYDLILLNKRVSTNEIKATLNSFSVDKSPGLDGWTPDFFIHFLNIFLKDIMDMVEEFRISGKFNGGIN